MLLAMGKWFAVPWARASHGEPIQPRGGPMREAPLEKRHLGLPGQHQEPKGAAERHPGAESLAAPQKAPFAAYVPDLPGCGATVSTREELLQEIRESRESIEFHIEVRGLTGMRRDVLRDVADRLRVEIEALWQGPLKGTSSYLIKITGGGTEILEVRGMIELPRDELLQRLSERLKVEIGALYKSTRNGRPFYQIIINGRTIDLGRFSILDSQKRFRERVAEMTDRVIPQQGREEWHRFTQDMLDVCEETPAEGPVQDTASPEAVAETSKWMKDYLAEHPATDDRNQIAITGEPVFKDNHIHIRLEKFRKWIYDKYGQRLTTQDLIKRLKACGVGSDKIDVTVEGIRSSRSTRKLPPALE